MDNEAVLVYDGECPICRHYSLKVQIEQSVGRLRLINARESSAEMDEITALGLDIDQGMVLKLKGQFYYGADAIYMLAQLGGSSKISNQLNYLFFGSKAGAKVFYPVVRFIRNLLLKLLRKTRIDNLRVDP